MDAIARDPYAAKQSSVKNGSHPGNTERTLLLNRPAADSALEAQNIHNGLGEERMVIASGLSSAKLALIMCTVWIGGFLGAIDGTIIATLSGPISSEFGSLNLLSWLATAYLISSVACQPIAGRLTDIFGRGPGLVFSNILFAAGNLICGRAQDQYAMILGRIIAGIGGGGLKSIANFLASDLIPLRRRGLVQGIANLWYCSGTMLGGFFGGWINDHTNLGWRLAFLIQVPPALLSAIAILVLVKLPPKQSDKSYLARIDFPGVLLAISFTVLLLIGLNSGGNLVPWIHPLPLTTIPFSVFVFVGFIWWESKAVQPIIPVGLLLDRTILAACSTNFLSEMLIMAAVFYVPLYLQVTGDSATSAGRKILSSPIGDSVGALGAGYIMKKTGQYVGLGIPSLLVSVVGTSLFALQGASSPAWLTSVAFFFVGGGYGAMLTTTQVACIAAVDHSQHAVVTSATYFIRNLGGTIGIITASAVYQNILSGRLWYRFGDTPGAADEIRRIRHGLGELKYLPEGWYDGVMESSMEAFQGVWLMMNACAVLALICISPMKQHQLHSTLDRQ